MCIYEWNILLIAATHHDGKISFPFTEYHLIYTRYTGQPISMTLYACIVRNIGFWPKCVPAHVTLVYNITNNNILLSLYQFRPFTQQLTMASLKPPGLAPSQPGYQSTSPTSYAYKSTARKEAVSVYKEMDHKANQYIFYMETQRMVDRALLVSCFVTWCCNIVFGIIAFFVACKIPYWPQISPRNERHPCDDRYVSET